MGWYCASTWGEGREGEEKEWGRERRGRRGEGMGRKRRELDMAGIGFVGTRGSLHGGGGGSAAVTLHRANESSDDAAGWDD